MATLQNSEDSLDKSIWRIGIFPLFFQDLPYLFQAFERTWNHFQAPPKARLLIYNIPFLFCGGIGMVSCQTSLETVHGAGRGRDHMAKRISKMVRAFRQSG